MSACLHLPTTRRVLAPIAVLVVLFAGGCGGSGAALEPESSPVAVEDAPGPAAPSPPAIGMQIPMDPAVRMGRLENGLTYYIRRNERPDARAELRLAINAGSILEDDDQLGLAHVVEHMAFNGTERFEKHELVDYLETTGVRFGADLNAYTSFDETVYQLQVRTDSMALFDTGIDVLREWASRVTFDPAEIDAERGVVLEEWRLGRGAAARMRDQQFPVLLYGSRYPDRLPIGTQESLQGFEHEALIRYYRQWYRPELAAVAVVGDVDPDYVEGRIRETFSNWSNPADPRPRVEFDIPAHEQTLTKTITDDEAPFSSVTVIYKHPGEPLNTVERYRTWLVEQFVHRMLNDRLEELTQSGTPPFFGAGSGKGSFARSRELYSLTAIAGEPGLLAALEAVLIEAERMRRHGFTDSEIDRVRAELLRAYETAYNERDKLESADLVDEYVAHFLEDTATPGIAWEYEIVQRLLPTVTAREINATARRLLEGEGRVVLMDGPTGTEMPADGEIMAIFDDVASRDVAPYVDETGDEPLFTASPVPGSVVNEVVDNDVHVTSWTLSNGARVVLKPTDFKNDEVLFAAYSPGGTSLVADELDVHADFASTLIGQGGVADFGPLELQKKLAGLIVQVQPTLSERSEGFQGRSSPQDLETLLQLVYLYATAPRADSTAFVSLVQRYGSVIETLKSDPSRAFADTLSVTLSQHHPRRRIIDREMLDELDLQTSHEIFADRFADVSDFTFYLVGAFGEPADVKPLVERYIASLPSRGREEAPRDLGIRPPEGKVERVVRKGQEPQSQVQIVLTGEAEWSQRNRRLMSLIEGVLDIRLREQLREDLGGTYGVGVSGSISREPVESFTLSIGFGCEPGRVEELTETVLAELERFRAEGAQPENIVKVRETTMTSHEVGLRENGYWLNSIMFYDRYGLDLGLIPAGAGDFYDSVTNEEIIEASRVFLDTTNYVRVVLVPETEPAG